MIYLVRHGETLFNAAGRFQGHQDSPLTPLGVSQARGAGLLLRDLRRGEAGWRLVSSPLGRTRQTAEIIAPLAGIDGDLDFDDRLKEMTLGSWDGLTRAEINSRAGTHEGHALKWWFQSPDGESYDALAGRLGAWLEEAVTTTTPLVVVSHGGAGRLIRGLYLGITPEAAFELEVPQDAIFRLSNGNVDRLDYPPA